MYSSFFKITENIRRAFLGSENLLALSRIILSAAPALAQFIKSLAIALSKQWAPLNFALIFKTFLVGFRHKFIHFFNFWLLFQRSTFKAYNSTRIEDIIRKHVINIWILFFNLLKKCMILSAKMSANLQILGALSLALILKTVFYG